MHTNQEEIIILKLSPSKISLEFPVPSLFFVFSALKKYFVLYFVMQ